MENLKYAPSIKDVPYILGSLLHPEDEPSIEDVLGGPLHREDGPALELANGTKHWYLNGLLHREGAPAIEYANGATRWYLNGKLHREDGPAVKFASGDKFWYLNGELYLKDGPAIEEATGDRFWCFKGELCDIEKGPVFPPYTNSLLTKWKGVYFRNMRLCNGDIFFSGEIKKVFLDGKFVSEEEYTLKPKAKPIDNSDGEIDWRT